MVLTKYADKQTLKYQNQKTKRQKYLCICLFACQTRGNIISEVQGQTGRFFQIRVGSGSGIGKNFGFGSGLGSGSGIGTVFFINRVLSGNENIDRVFSGISISRLRFQN